MDSDAPLLQRRSKPWHEPGPVSSRREGQGLVVQQSNVGVPQRAGGRAVDEAVADRHAALRRFLEAAFHKRLHSARDPPPALRDWQVIDGLVDRVDQPEPALLKLSEDPRLRLASQGLSVKPEHSLDHSAKQVVRPEVVGVEEGDCLATRRRR